MYIAPNSDIKILSGVPLDNTYEHTISWEQNPTARTTQANYFLSKVKYSFTNQYYQRVKRGWLKIQCNPDNLYDCNYLMFKNKSFGDKWFYAFILSIEYINNETAQINYEVDVMQTWLRGTKMDYNPEACFVERQHTPTDTLYGNLVPEEIANAGGEYFVDEEQVFDMNTMRILMYLSVERKNDEWVAADGAMYDNVYGGVKLYYAETNQAGVDIINSYIKDIAKNANPEDIVSIKQAPLKFFTYTPTATGSTPTEYTVQLSKPKSGQTLGGKNSGYVPRNMKMYTYPFNRIIVNNLCGDYKEYKWEEFTNEDDRGKFGVVGTYAWKSQAVAYPKNYRGITKPIEDGVIFDAFPVCCWNGDAYKAWWAQNMGHIITNYANGILQMTGVPTFSSGSSYSKSGSSSNISRSSGTDSSISRTGSSWSEGGGVSVSANPVGGAVNILTTTLNAYIDSKHVNNKIYGSTDNAALLPAMKAMEYRITRQSFRKETLRRYDRFFTKFGYAIKDITVPGYRNRERWTYVKTVGCNIQSTLNNEDSDKICEIYNNGITFWVNPNDIGNYELSNNPNG